MVGQVTLLRWSRWLVSVFHGQHKTPRVRRRMARIEALEDRVLLSATTSIAEVKTLGSIDFNADWIPSAETSYKLFTRDEFGADLIELWATDGTAGGTIKLREFNQLFLYDWSVDTPFLYYHGEYYFAGHDIEGDSGLFKTNGTPEGTVLVTAAPTTPQNFTILNDKMYFVASDEAHGRELWTSDGTAQGTHMLVDIYPGSNWGIDGFGGTALVVVNDKIVFAAESSFQNTELWVSDGTAQGTQLLKNIYTGSQILPFNNSISSSSDPRDLTLVGNQIVFTARDYSDPDNFYVGTMWATDGTTAGTVKIRDLTSPVAGTSATYISAPEFLGVMNGELFFSPETDDPNSAYELWATNGTLAGTRFVKALRSGEHLHNIHVSAVSNGLLYLNAGDNTHGEFEPWISDGTSQGTRLLKDVGQFGKDDDIPSGRPSNFTPFGDQYTVFRANDGKKGSELWLTDGTESGTIMVTDINQGKGHSFPYPGPTVNGKLLFFANTKTTFNLYQLSVDGGQSGTAPKINPQTFNLAENSPADTVVGTVVATSGGKKSKLAFAITGGDASGTFAIDEQTGELRVVNASILDFEATPTFSLTVTVTAKGGATASATITVQLANVTETITLSLAGSPLAVASNASPVQIDPLLTLEFEGAAPTNWSGAQLVVSIVKNRQKKDLLQVISQGTGDSALQVKGKKLLRSGEQIGTLSGGKGKQGTLRVTFTSAATLSDVEATLRQTSFSTKSSAALRTAVLQMINVQGTNSNAAGRDLAVS